MLGSENDNSRVSEPISHLLAKSQAKCNALKAIISSYQSQIQSLTALLESSKQPQGHDQFLRISRKSSDIKKLELKLNEYKSRCTQSARESSSLRDTIDKLSNTLEIKEHELKLKTEIIDQLREENKALRMRLDMYEPSNRDYLNVNDNQSEQQTYRKEKLLGRNGRKTKVNERNNNNTAENILKDFEFLSVIIEEGSESFLDLTNADKPVIKLDTKTKRINRPNTIIPNIATADRSETQQEKLFNDFLLKPDDPQLTTFLEHEHVESEKMYDNLNNHIDYLENMLIGERPIS